MKTKNPLLNTFSMIFLLIALASCGGKGKKEKTSIAVVLQGNAAVNQSATGTGPRWGQSSPTSTNGFNCFGVFVTYHDMPNNSSCKDSSFNVIATPHELVGTLPLNTIIEHDVRISEKVTFQVIGWYAADGHCPSFHSDIKSQEDNLSPPHILGQVTRAIDSNTSNVAINANIDGGKQINECNGAAFQIENPVNSACRPENSLAESNSNFADGDGSSSDPFIICNPDQFGLINATSQFYELGQDIDFQSVLKSTAIVPSFSGEFNGNGFNVSNINIAGSSNLGLFGDISGSQSAVRHLFLENVNILGTSRVGALAGLIVGEVIVENIFATGKIMAKDIAGGIVGKIAPSAGKDITFKSIINATQVEKKISSSGHLGNLGGIAGLVEIPAGNGSILFNKISNLGDISALDGNTDAENIGGLFGHFVSNSTIAPILSNFVNRGNVYGRSNIGGIIGLYPTSPQSLVLKSGFNEGDIVNISLPSFSNLFTGGFIGHSDGDIAATDIFQAGRVLKGLGTGPEFQSPFGAVIHESGDFAIAADDVNGTLLKVDLITGDRSVLSENTNFGNAGDLDLDEINGMDFNSDHSKLITVSRSNSKIISTNMNDGSREFISSNSNPAGGPSLGTLEDIVLLSDTMALVVDSGRSSSLISVNLNDGSRAEINLSGGTSFSNPVGIVLNNAKDHAYVVDSGAGLFEVELGPNSFSKNNLSLSGDSISNAISITLDARDDNIAYVLCAAGPPRIIKVDLTTHVGTKISSPSTPVGFGTDFNNPVSISFNSQSNKLFVFDQGHNALLEVDPISGDRYLASSTGNSSVTKISHTFVELTSGSSISNVSFLNEGGGFHDVSSSCLGDLSNCTSMNNTITQKSDLFNFGLTAADWNFSPNKLPVLRIVEE
jgi:hypothetical protein